MSGIRVGKEKKILHTEKKEKLSCIQEKTIIFIFSYIHYFGLSPLWNLKSHPKLKKTKKLLASR